VILDLIECAFWKAYIWITCLELSNEISFAIIIFKDRVVCAITELDGRNLNTPFFLAVSNVIPEEVSLVVVLIVPTNSEV